MKHIEQLYEKYLNGTISNAERKELIEQIKRAGDDRLGQLASKYLDASVPEDLSHLDDHSERILQQIKGRIEKKEDVNPRKLWPVLFAATAVLIVIGSGILFYLNSQKIPVESQSSYVKDLAPGKAGATLTLADGKKIKLANVINGEIANESGISVSKTADGQLIYQVGGNVDASGKMNTLTTARGETYILSLPDKTQVWLNAASSLTYSVALNERGQRRVKLSGEAYFQVAKDKLHPFIVETDNQQVEVLGTHFNIRAYNLNDIVTTLEEGSVKVASLRTNRNAKILKPSQQAINTANELIVQPADMESSLAWKNGLLFFKDAPLHAVLDEISRWYDVEIEYRSKPSEELFSGSVSRNSNLSAMLKILKITGVKSSLVSEGKTRKLIIE